MPFLDYFSCCCKKYSTEETILFTLKEYIRKSIFSAENMPTDNILKMESDPTAIHPVVKRIIQNADPDDINPMIRRIVQ